MTIRVGTAPDSWGVWFPSDPRQTPWNRFLDEVALAGYAAIELGPFGYLPADPDRLGDELRKRSLQLVAGTFSGDLDTPDGWRDLHARVVEVCDLLHVFDARYLVVLDTPYVDLAGKSVGPRELDESGWRSVRDTLHRFGEYTASRGVQLAFHPHADTTIQHEVQIERLLDATDAALVNLCLDVGHHAYAGGDPVAFLRQHYRRINYLHLKDINASVVERIHASRWPFVRAVAEGAFVELGQGNVDLVGISRGARDVGLDVWGIVEQDMYPAAFDKPYPIARRNLEFLRSTGFVAPV